MRATLRASSIARPLLAGALLLFAGCGTTQPDSDPDGSTSSLAAPAEKAATVQTGATATGCVGEYQGGDTSCKDEATWISYASQSCEKQGLALGYYAFSTECGKGLWRYIKYECCPKETSCTTDAMGSETSCKDESTWKSYASDACLKQGLELNNYWLSTECGTALWRYVKYECCGASDPTPKPTPEPTPEPTPKPTPTPTPCTGDVLGSDSSCKTTAMWKRYASMACEQQGLHLSDYATFEQCGKDRWRYVKYSCCP